MKVWKKSSNPLIKIEDLTAQEGDIVKRLSKSEGIEVDNSNERSLDKFESKKDEIKYTPHKKEKAVELPKDHSDELYEITLDPETNKPSKIEKI